MDASLVGTLEINISNDRPEGGDARAGGCAHEGDTPHRFQHGVDAGRRPGIFVKRSSTTAGLTPDAILGRALAVGRDPAALRRALDVTLGFSKEALSAPPHTARHRAVVVTQRPRCIVNARVRSR